MHLFISLIYILIGVFVVLKFEFPEKEKEIEVYKNEEKYTKICSYYSLYFALIVIFWPIYVISKDIYNR